MYGADDTIVAIASPPGGGLRGILRLSGPDVIRCVERCFRGAAGQGLSERARPAVIPGYLQLPPPLGELECDLYLWPGPRSYTKQTVAELHTFGSPPLLDAALQVLCEAGARIAAPGEFTMRAFLAGRIDLTQAEAVLGVIDARDRRELQVALAQLAGGLAVPLKQLRSELLDLLADLEAGLDFVEEGLEFLSPQETQQRLSAMAERISSIESQLAARSTREGVPRVVLLGWPNVGKSSLLNALAGAEAAIVSQIPGTTRDYVARRAVIDGMEMLLVDTAGFEDPACARGELAAAAQAICAGQIAGADLQLLCLDSTRPLNSWERAQLAASNLPSRLVVLTKTDAGPSPDLPAAGIATSSVTGAGMGELRRRIRERLEALPGASCLAVASTAARCRESLRLAAQCLSRARDVLSTRSGDELVASEVRLALDELGTVVGAVYTEDLLDRIFSRFCVGK